MLKLEYSYGTNTQNNGSLREQKITVPTAGSSSPGFTAVQTYTYDNLNRLESADEKPLNYTQTQCSANPSQCWKQTFLYDRYGNREFNTAAGATTTLNPAVPDKVKNPQINTSDNRFQKDQDNDTLTDYDYDKAGNLIRDAVGWQFFYDAENHQKQVKNANGVTVGTYLYDGDGKRVKKITATETTVFVYNGGGQLVAEYSTQVASVSEAQVSYLTQDHLGSPRIITGKDGAVIKRQDYSAFGEENYLAQRTANAEYMGQMGENQPTRKGYTGYEKDGESELEFAQARYYNSSHGRFTSVDPLTASATIKDPQTFNRYSYVLNSPYKFSDPLGLLPEGRRGSDGSCGAEYSSCSDEMPSVWEGREDVPESTPPDEGVTANHELGHNTQQDVEDPELPPAPSAEQNAETTIQVGTVIIAYGQPGIIQDVGGNFERAASTMQENYERQGVKVINVGEISSFSGFQNVLNTAAKNNASAILLFTHGASVALDLGDGPRSDTKDVTMNNVGKLYNSNESLTYLIIYGCNVGSIDNGIGQALSNQLKVTVQASTTGQSFSASPTRLTNSTGKHPDTGPTYMVPEGNGKWRFFTPSR